MASHEFHKVHRNNDKQGKNIFSIGRNLNKSGDKLSKSERIMEGVGVWTSFYRSNPHKFVEDYLGVKLKLFQQILIMMMMHNNYFMYLASRGQGKTFLTAIYCCVRAILFPNSKIVIAAGRLSQSRAVIEKIEEIRVDSLGLQREIKDFSTGSKDPYVTFHNGSWIKTVAANDGARSKRANCLIVDEFRMVDASIISTVLRKFLTAPRSPGYLKKKEYAHLTERNQELYLSSAWYKFHWSYKRLLAYFDSMLDGRKYFVCGLPYQLAIKENLLARDQVEDEMAETDFSPLEFFIEMECMFYGESEKAYYNFEELTKNRKMPKPLYPDDNYSLVRDKSFKPEPKKNGEVRLVSCDIAAMAGKQNDASISSLIRLIPNANGYIREVAYMESSEGQHTQLQAVRIRQLYEDFDADYIVMDTQSIGLGVYDQLVIPLLDEQRGKEYEPLSCINDEKMADRCTYPDAKKVIYSIKGNAQLNSEAAISLKDGLQLGKVRLLVPENEGRDFLSKIKGFNELTEDLKVDFELPYKQTTLLINEMVNLEGERNPDTGLMRLREVSGGRKDRFSSLAYGNYIANQLEREMLRGHDDIELSDYMYFAQSGF